MRILRIYAFLPPLSGGMEKHVLRLTQEQRLLGCEVVVAFNQGQSSSTDDIHIFPSFNLRRIKPQLFRDLIFYLLIFFQIVFKRIRFDVVHVHGDWSAFFLGRLIAYVAKAKKLVGSLHGVAKRAPWGSVYQLALKNYSLIYTTGAEDAAYLESLIDTPVFWQHSGIDSMFIAPLDDRQIYLYDVVTVGSFLPVKNFDLVIEIAALLPGIKFVMIGDGPQRPELEEKCKLRGIINVTFIGHLSTLDVVKYLRCSRIFLSTSFSEGTPTALLEAMASGLAIVISRSNNYEYLLKDGQNGYVIDNFHAINYANRIQELIDDKEILQEISHANWLQASQYEWATVAKRIAAWMTL